MDIVYFDRGVYLVKKVPKPSLIATRKRENIILIKKKKCWNVFGKMLNHGHSEIINIPQCIPRLKCYM